MNHPVLELNERCEAELPHEALNRLLAADERNLAWLMRRLDEAGKHRSFGHIYRVSTGERPISPGLAEDLAKIFGVPAETFLPGGER